MAQSAHIKVNPIFLQPVSFLHCLFEPGTLLCPAGMIFQRVNAGNRPNAFFPQRQEIFRTTVSAIYWLTVLMNSDLSIHLEASSFDIFPTCNISL